MRELVLEHFKRQSHCHDFVLCCPLDLLQYFFEVLQLHITVQPYFNMSNMALLAFNAGILCILQQFNTAKNRKAVQLKRNYNI